MTGQAVAAVTGKYEAAIMAHLASQDASMGADTMATALSLHSLSCPAQTPPSWSHLRICELGIAATKVVQVDDQAALLVLNHGLNLVVVDVAFSLQQSAQPLGKAFGRQPSCLSFKDTRPAATAAVSLPFSHLIIQKRQPSCLLGLNLFSSRVSHLGGKNKAELSAIGRWAS